MGFAPLYPSYPTPNGNDAGSLSFAGRCNIKDRKMQIPMNDASRKDAHALGC